MNRWGIVLNLYCFFAGLLLFSVCLMAEVEVAVETDYYRLGARNATILRWKLLRRGVEGDNGKKYKASTIWAIYWDYDCNRDGSSYFIKNSRVKVVIKFLFPRWINVSLRPRYQREWWYSYLWALKRHEEGHSEIAVNAGREIEKALRSLPPAGSCEELELIAEKIIANIIATYEELEREYDRETEHGAKQGAVLR